MNQIRLLLNCFTRVWLRISERLLIFDMAYTSRTQIRNNDPPPPLPKPANPTRWWFIKCLTTEAEKYAREKDASIHPQHPEPSGEMKKVEDNFNQWCLIKSNSIWVPYTSIWCAKYSYTVIDASFLPTLATFVSISPPAKTCTTINTQSDTHQHSLAHYLTNAALCSHQNKQHKFRFQRTAVGRWVKKTRNRQLHDWRHEDWPMSVRGGGDVPSDKGTQGPVFADNTHPATTASRWLRWSTRLVVMYTRRRLRSLIITRLHRLHLLHLLPSTAQIIYPSLPTSINLGSRGVKNQLTFSQH